MAAPLIAVTGRRRSAKGLHTGPPSMDALTMDAYFAGYAEHVAAAGGFPVHVPFAVDPSTALDRMDGLVLTGGNDIDPASHGAPAAEGTGATDPDRDRFEFALLDAALAAGLPVLGICRGLQLLNVARGGTLHADLPEHSALARHEITTLERSALGELHGAATSVNSLHHQGVDRLGRGLVATAWAPDGVVEGVELPGTDVVAVQWHPEQMDGAPQPEFRWIVDAAVRSGRATSTR